MAQTTWSDAFTALEEDLGTLLALARAYDSHLEGVAKGAAKRVRGAISRSHEVSVDTDDEAPPGQWGMTVELGGELVDAGLDVRTWAAAPYGGPPGQMRACLYMSDEPAEGMPELDAMLELARSVVGSATEHLDAIDVLDPGEPPLAVRSLEISSDGLDASLAQAVIELVQLGENVGQVLLELRELTPYVLLLDALRRVRLEGTLERAAGTAIKPNKWAGGQDIIVNGKGVPQVWITAFPSGELALHWGAKRDQDKRVQDLVASAIGGTADDRLGYLGVLLMDANAVQVVIDTQDSEDAKVEVAARIVTAWERWRDLM